VLALLERLLLLLSASTVAHRGPIGGAVSSNLRECRRLVDCRLFLLVFREGVEVVISDSVDTVDDESDDEGDDPPSSGLFGGARGVL
jgi:hypothetical protein